MRKEEFDFLSKDGVTNIHAVKWIPDSGEYKAIFQIVHGMIEYIERYEDFANFLTENGYLVVGHDHLGHGRSVRSEKEYGYFTEDNPSDVLVDDINRLREIIQKDNPDKPYFILGHSMGSYMLRKYLAKYNKNLRGAIVCGTGYASNAKAKCGLGVAGFLSKIRGSHYRSKLYDKLIYGKSYKDFDMTGKDLSKSHLTRDIEIVKKYVSSPYCSFNFTMNGYKGLLEAVYFSCQQENVDKIPDKLPIFLISGSNDPVGDLGVGVKKVYNMFLKSGKLDLTYKLYEDYRHEILNEIGKEKVYEDILAWTNVRIET